ncbi:hypothetical protein [Antarctobacter sp.]|uniref:hypothetical protein n=1 Tax=Antarctobacter sp. TaxID=1872577 RepID=UPI002B26E469|nr:hypothetical protein [Antarctobacter sp.]
MNRSLVNVIATLSIFCLLAFAAATLQSRLFRAPAVQRVKVEQRPRFGQRR